MKACNGMVTQNFMTDGGESLKKTYETPAAEKVCFDYQEQVVASGSDCYWAGQTVRAYQGCTETHTGAMNK